MDIFSNDLNSSMILKGQHPDYTLIASLEADPSEFESFWKDKSILSYISAKTIVVRLFQNKNSSDINLFQYTFKHSHIPSLFVFGPNQAAITYSWNDHFPSIDEFSHYFDEINKSSSTNNIDTIEPKETPSQNQAISADSIQQLHNEENADSTNDNNHSLSHTPLNAPSSNKTPIQRPPPRAQLKQKSPLITSSADRSNSMQINSQKARNTARISVQGLTKTITKVFPSNSTIGDLRDWVHSEFGRDLDLIIVHSHMPLPTDRNTTFSEADLCPSAFIKERDGGEAILRNDEQLNIGISDGNERIHENINSNQSLNQIYEEENSVTNAPSSANSTGSSSNNNNNRIRRTNNTNNNNNGFGLILKYARLLFRMLNPWADDEDENEEDADFENNLWEFKPNPNYINSMLNQMYQDSRQNVQQEDSWHPSRF